ncbi:FecR family protein [Dyadobacter aurulentus]|uniref:FecR family protein n=1 Tax=Dyadobacter sp. UC 10 TaxID=2605428 RepID=UPI0011F1F0B7|nr:FecR family protein [Dyadobacter sp. UC 10]KAA0989125.1 DUF4974 domain-containing protein [Dyadobacter sp. UC 10]
MDSYLSFSVEDFVWDDAFRNWVLRPTREDQTKWETWLRENPTKAETVFQARELVLALGPGSVKLPPLEKERAVSRIMDQFDERLDKAATGAVFSGSRWLLAACSVILVMGIAWLFNKYDKRPVRYEQLVSAAETELREVQNVTDKVMRIQLPDSSSVLLDPGSKLSFPDQFAAGKREVILSGSAFFDITRQANRPFYVYADEIVTKVLGTSFHVRSFSDEKDVSVEVKTGRVAVFTAESAQIQNLPAGNELSGVVIEPNQRIVVARETAKMTKTLVPNPVPITSEHISPDFKFEDFPVSEIFKTLQKAYGIEIIFDENIMKDCPVTATLTDLSLYEKLDLVCNAVGAKYEVIDGRIIVEGKGCQDK